MKQYGLAALALLLQTTHVSAGNGDTPSISFDGYGTVGIVHSTEDRADFVSNPGAPEGAGHTDTWSAEVDSRLGLQLTANITPKLSSIVQVVVEQRYDDTWTPTLEWANLKYEITPDLYIRAGRVVLPSFLVSDYRKLGYALPWVRPPLEVYNLQTVTSSDGVDAGYTFRLGEFTNTLRFIYGNKDLDLPGNTKVEVRDLWALSGTIERGPLTLNANYVRGRATVVDLIPLFDAFRQFGAEGEAIADRYGFDDKAVEFFGAGVRYDPGDWFVLGEWGRFQGRVPVRNHSGWYVTGGYRFGEFTPYATFAYADVDDEIEDPGLNLAALPPAQAGVAAGLNAGLNQVWDNFPAQKRFALGLRWDFTASFALKMQYEYTDLETGSPGFLVNEQPGFNRGDSFSLFSTTIDFVF